MQNQAKKSVNEIFIIRSFACMSVVLLHAISSSFKVPNLVSPDLEAFWKAIMMLFLYGTPTFILISEFLLARTYSDQLPQGFYSKRVRYILFPYLSMAIVYTLFQTWYQAHELDAYSFLKSALLTIVTGKYHGYFILIIFQFYLLHPVFHKYIYKRYSANRIVIISFIISFLYQASFNAFKIPYEQIYSGILFPGWLVYFTVGFYAGKNYDQLKERLGRYVRILVPLLILSFMVLLFTYFVIHFERINSRRADVIIYTLIVSALVFYAAAYIRKIPLLIVEISSCSLGIYLLHPFILRLIERYIPPGLLLNQYPVVYILFAFTTALTVSMLLVYALNTVKIGSYLVGRVNRTVLPNQDADQAQQLHDKPELELDLAKGAS